MQVASKIVRTAIGWNDQFVLFEVVCHEMELRRKFTEHGDEWIRKPAGSWTSYEMGSMVSGKTRPVPANSSKEARRVFDTMSVALGGDVCTV